MARRSYRRGPREEKAASSREKAAEREKWSGREDSNLRPHGPEPCALPGCATPRGARTIPWPVAFRDRSGPDVHGRRAACSAPHRRAVAARVGDRRERAVLLERDRVDAPELPVGVGAFRGRRARAPSRGALPSRPRETRRARARCGPGGAGGGTARGDRLAERLAAARRVQVDLQDRRRDRGCRPASRGRGAGGRPRGRSSASSTRAAARPRARRSTRPARGRRRSRRRARRRSRPSRCSGRRRRRARPCGFRACR